MIASRSAWFSVTVLLALSCTTAMRGQSWVDAQGPLDPTHGVVLAPEPRHAPLREEYIWTANDAAALADRGHYAPHSQTEKLQPHFFRASFDLADLPRHATLYIAGPRLARIYLNGKLAADIECHPVYPIVFETLNADVVRSLRRGRNVIAIEAVRGWSHTHHTNSMLTAQLNMGEVLAVKIVPQNAAVDAKPVLISSAVWRSTLSPKSGWENTLFDDSSWPTVQSLGSIESSAEFFQWNADAGLYNWPGYIGISPRLRRYRMLPARVSIQHQGSAQFSHIDTLTKLRAPAIQNEAAIVTPLDTGAESPSLLLDFGREVAGRLLLQAENGRPLTAELRYGESIEEAMNGPFLGVQKLWLPSHGVARGAKSAFRYALLSFPAAAGTVRLRQAALEGIEYPVHYRASFESSDPVLNRIWETAAYTAHLCMQEGIWDAPKRDRGKWMGDMDVTARVIDAVFANSALNEQTFQELAGPVPIATHVNSMPSYTPFWVIGEAAHYRRFGSLNALRTVHEQLKGLLQKMEGELDAEGRFANPHGDKLFVDWAPGFDRDTPQARSVIQLEYTLAFSEGAMLLRALGETALATHYEARSAQTKHAAQQYLLDPLTDLFGASWQANAMAVVSCVATTEQGKAIHAHALASVGGDAQHMQRITPYYGFYLLEALARLGHTEQALGWMRQYWGGMLQEDASSFWEAYDPRWPRQQPHRSLEADNKVGYYVSMAHGWASGPALWLQEHVLGVTMLEPGGHSFLVRPEYSGLAWARGDVPAAGGVLHVDIRNGKIFTMLLNVPPGCHAEVHIPPEIPGKIILLNGRVYPVRSISSQSEQRVLLADSGHYEIQVQ